MNEEPPDRPGSIAGQVVIRPVGLDDWSSVRALHTSAFQRFVVPLIEEESAAAAVSYLGSPDYLEGLRLENLHSAWLDGYLVGTCGWVPGDDAVSAARITSVFVDPLFNGLGIGRRLVQDAEARGWVAGYRSFTARAADHSVGFFLALGYEVTAFGLSARTSELAVPITYMRRRPAAPIVPADIHHGAGREPAVSILRSRED
jgi:GNAT superfamily N-acetyltransferase